MITQFRKLFTTLILASFLFFISCNNEENVFKKLSGVLVIEEMEYKNENYNEFLFLNVLIFKKSKTNYPLVIIPKTIEYEKEVAVCYLSIENKDVFLKIDSKNEIFKGTYQVIFFKNKDRKLLGVELTSKDLTIKGYMSQKDYYMEGLNW